MIIVYFLLWTLLLYVIHRLGHKVPYVRELHLDHHRFINNFPKSSWHWNNLFLFNDTWKSTGDLWITEVIPTFLFAYITGQWWIFIFYYLWAALFQEKLEHNSKVDFPLLTSGKWHLIHHRSSYNYGLFIPIWDILFKTYRKVE